ncbi:hypothetical protein, partial [Methanosarcina mazei]|uniref:hypothetical protein n=1 Tax=Methanosarcina mazei TaxID=2209 RepID=UPI000B078DD2
KRRGEGSLHPHPKGWGIRDPLRSLSNKVNEVTAKRIKTIRKYFMFIRVPHRILLKNYCF